MSDAVSNVVGVATVMLSKKEGWQTTMTHTLCWRAGVSDKDTMRGLAVASAMEMKPGFSVDSVLVEIITLNTKLCDSPGSGASPTLEELGKLSTDLDMYMDWAQVWHKQAGGYTASDTFLTMMRMEKWARRLQELTGKPETPLRKIEAAEEANPSRPNTKEKS